MPKQPAAMWCFQDFDDEFINQGLSKLELQLNSNSNSEIGIGIEKLVELKMEILELKINNNKIINISLPPWHKQNYHHCWINEQC